MERKSIFDTPPKIFGYQNREIFPDDRVGWRG